MNKNQEKIKTALESIENCLATINTNEDWLKYLCFNLDSTAILLEMQCLF